MEESPLAACLLHELAVIAYVLILQGCSAYVKYIVIKKYEEIINNQDYGANTPAIYANRREAAGLRQQIFFCGRIFARFFARSPKPVKPVEKRHHVCKIPQYSTLYRIFLQSITGILVHNCSSYCCAENGMINRGKAAPVLGFALINKFAATI